VEEQEYTFLFAEGSKVVVMHPDTFEQARHAERCCGCGVSDALVRQ